VTYKRARPCHSQHTDTCITTTIDKHCIICIAAIVLNPYRQEWNCHDLITITIMHLCISRLQLLCHKYCCIAPDTGCLNSLLHPLLPVTRLFIARRWLPHVQAYCTLAVTIIGFRCKCDVVCKYYRINQKITTHWQSPKPPQHRLTPPIEGNPFEFSNLPC